MVSPTTKNRLRAALLTKVMNLIAHASSHVDLYSPVTKSFIATPVADTRIPSPFPIATNEWPSTLPSKSLTLHLIDFFFTYYPQSRRVIHRPTFMLQLLENPSSPRFPFVPLLRAICAAGALYSPLITVAPLPDLSKYPVDDVFAEKTRAQLGRQLTFDEQQYTLSKYECMSAASEGENLIGVIQGNVQA